MTELFPHQKEAALALIRHKYFILALDMGLGKSLCALAAAHRLGLLQKTLIVCPAFLKYVWLSEMETHFPDDPCHIYVKGSNRSGLRIVNYEQIHHMEKEFKNYSVIIVDEVHYLKSSKAKRTKLFHDLVKKNKPNFLWMLSGTPIKNRVQELYSPLVLCGYLEGNENGVKVKDHFKSQTSFCDHFCYVRIKRVASMVLQEYYGLKNIPDLKNLLAGKLLVRKAKDVLNLPESRTEILPVANVSGRNSDLSNAFENYQKNRGTESPVKVQTAIEKTQFTMPVILQLLDEDEGPIVVFSDHVEPIRAMYHALEGYIGEFIDGSVPMEKRFELVTRFQNGLVDVLFCTVGAASVGLTLTAGHVMVFNDLPWVPGDLDQTMKRISRIGQLQKCLYLFITAPGIDSQIARTLEEKRKVIREILS